MQQNTISKRSKSKKLDTRAAITQLKVDALPSSVFYGSSDIFPYGIDNYYPWRIKQAIRKSPTATGCNRRLTEFIYGLGFGEAGKIVVNRYGETLNKIVLKFIESGYAPLYGGGLHFNFNALGQITEIFFVDIEYIRKLKNLCQADYWIWTPDYGNGIFADNPITIDLYGVLDPVERMQEEGLENYKGQLYYYSKNSDIYPTSLFDTVAVSAEYEREAQIYPYANIKNGFSGTTIVKKPSFGSGTDTDGVDELELNINKLSGAENAGSKLVVEVPIDTDGRMHNANLVEHLTPPNIDGMFEKQNLGAQNSILKAAMMPGILLGIENKGMFNEASFHDAWNYKVSDTEYDRQIIEEEFNSIISKSVWKTEPLKLIPPNMKGGTTNG